MHWRHEDHTMQWVDSIELLSAKSAVIAHAIILIMSCLRKQVTAVQPFEAHSPKMLIILLTLVWDRTASMSLAMQPRFWGELASSFSSLTSPGWAALFMGQDSSAFWGQVLPTIICVMVLMPTAYEERVSHLRRMIYCA
jgi:hypothetical protein